MTKALCVVIAAAAATAGCATVKSATGTVGSADRAFSRLIDWEWGEEPQGFDIWYGEAARVRESGYIVARNPMQWRDAWALTDQYVRPGLYRGPSVSPADYVGPPIVLTPEVHTGVALYAGSRDGGGSQIVVERVRMKKGVLTVEARTSGGHNDPRFARDGSQSTPYAILRVQAAPREVVVQFASAAGGSFGGFSDASSDPFGSNGAVSTGDPFGGGQPAADPFSTAAPAPGATPAPGSAPAPGSDEFDAFSGGQDDPFAGATPVAPAEPTEAATPGSEPRPLASPDDVDEER